MANKDTNNSLQHFKSIDSSICVLCDGHDHLVENCPGLPIINAEQANVLNAFHKPNSYNNTFNETYNSGWQNHPNYA